MPLIHDAASNPTVAVGLAVRLTRRDSLTHPLTSCCKDVIFAFRDKVGGAVDWFEISARHQFDSKPSYS